MMINNNHNSNGDEELNLYSKILDCYDKAANNRDQLEFCKNKSIIHLMKVANRQNKQDRIKNGLIFILNLFEEEKANPDLFTGLGVDKSRLNQEQKKQLIEKLKQEIN